MIFHSGSGHLAIQSGHALYDNARDLLGPSVETEGLFYILWFLSIIIDIIRIFRFQRKTLVVPYFFSRKFCVNNFQKLINRSEIILTVD